MAERIALVTGSAGPGIGRSIALTLARDGYDVMLNWRRDRVMSLSDERVVFRSSLKEVERVSAAIESMGRHVAAHQADVSHPEQAEALVRQTEGVFGRLDLLVISAGGPWKPQDITEIEPEHLRKVLATEIESAYALLRAALPGMRERRHGRIVLIGGHMADDWRFGPPDAPLDYPLGKAARHWLVRTLAPREREHGITINAVAPGPTRRFTHEEAIAALESTPAGNELTPQHVADTVAWLCTEAGARTTGAIISLPGARPV